MQRGSELTSHVCGLGAILIIVEEGKQLTDSGGIENWYKS